jgi:WD40 repeat protein
VALWYAERGWSPGPSSSPSGQARALAFSPDGCLLAVGRAEPGVILRDPDGGPRGDSLGTPIRGTNDLKFSPDGRTLAVSGADPPGILLWDLVLGRERATLRGHSASVISMAFAPDGRSLASAAGTTVDPGVRIWDLSTGRMKRRISDSGPAIAALAYSPDGRLIAGASPHERQVRLWDAGTGEQVRVIAGHSRPCRSVAFSPDGGLLAATGSDGDLRLWDMGEWLRGPSDR